MSRLKELYAQVERPDDPLSPTPGGRLARVARQCGAEEVRELFGRIAELEASRSDPERDDWEPDDIFEALNNLTTILYAVPEGTLPAVLEGLNSDNVEVRYRVALALGDRRDNLATTALEQALRTERLDHVRKALNAALTGSTA